MYIPLLLALTSSFALTTLSSALITPYTIPIPLQLLPNTTLPRPHPNNTTNPLSAPLPMPPFPYPIGPNFDIIITSYSLITSYPPLSLANTLRYIRDLKAIMDHDRLPNDRFLDSETFTSSAPLHRAGARVEFGAKRPFTVRREQADRVLDTLVEIEETFGPVQFGNVEVRCHGTVLSRLRLDILG